MQVLFARFQSIKIPFCHLRASRHTALYRITEPSDTTAAAKTRQSYSTSHKSESTNKSRFDGSLVVDRSQVFVGSRKVLHIRPPHNHLTFTNEPFEMDWDFILYLPFHFPVQ